MVNEPPLVLIVPMTERIRYLLSFCSDYKGQLERLSDGLNIAMAEPTYDWIFDDIVSKYSDSEMDFRTNCFMFGQIVVALWMVIDEDLSRIRYLTIPGEIPYVRDMEIQDSWWIASVGFKPCAIDE